MLPTSMPSTEYMPDTTPANGLATLEARLRQDLDWLDLPAKPWVKPRLHAGEAVLDVAIIGGGMRPWACRR